MDRFLNILKAQSARLDQTAAETRVGVVSSVDALSYTARVFVQPEGVLSGWLPIASAWIGNGWGMACPPAPGDQVIVLWHEGDAEHGIVVGRLWSAQTTVPPAASGEIWIIHQSGSFLKLLNDGSIQSAAPTWTHSGDLHVTGDVSDSHGTLAALRAHYDEHTHPPSSAPASPQD